MMARMDADAEELMAAGRDQGRRIRQAAAEATAITRIGVFPADGSFAIGSSARLYGKAAS